jgi:hypothetical protein
MSARYRPIPAIQNELRLLAQELSEALVFQEAIGMAYAERVGEELEPGGEYTVADRARAEEIMLLYPEKDA